eukprot:424217-Amphidinium_carterae.1
MCHGRYLRGIYCPSNLLQDIDLMPPRQHVQLKAFCYESTIKQHFGLSPACDLHFENRLKQIVATSQLASPGMSGVIAQCAHRLKPTLRY